MEKLKAKLTFITGIGCDAALVEIDSNCEEMITNDIYDCGVFDWIAYNLEIEVPTKSTLVVNVDVKPSYWGDEIEEINYYVNGEILVTSDINQKRQAIAELLALHKQDRAKVNSQCDSLINMSTVEKYLRSLG